MEKFDWNRFRAYRVFDEFLDRFILKRRSYVTRHNEILNLEKAFQDIRIRFVDSYDESNKTFEEKVIQQFDGAAEQTKIVFANVEYLYAMPMKNISPERKRSYLFRWFPDAKQVVSGEEYFFGDPDTIADPGSWYLRNKYWELVAALRILSIVIRSSGENIDLISLKREIADNCYSAMYRGAAKQGDFAVSKYCGIHPALMHLSDPNRYESIISDSHRRQICGVFRHTVEMPSNDIETLLRQIRSVLYDSFSTGDDPDRKYRWFFYFNEVKPLWFEKRSSKQQRTGSVNFEIRQEEDATDTEGVVCETKGYKIRRSAKLAQAAKVRDNYTCRACGFHFKNLIVHVHHLDPLSEHKQPKKTRLKDLVTLCPSCHYIAHYWLCEDAKFKNLEVLLKKLSFK